MTIRLPKPFVGAATIGSSGDARIVRCFDGTSHYWTKTKPGEIAMPGLRRVQNWVPSLDITTWGNSGVTITPLGNVGPNGLPAYRIAFTGDPTVWRGISFSIVGTENRKRLGSVWWRNVNGAGIWLYAKTANSGRHYGYASDWERITTPPDAGPNAAGFDIYQPPNTGTTADVIEICAPQLELDVDTPNEEIDPDVDYGFGAPGVAYFAYQNPFAVDANGIVTDTGVRTPISGGGIVAAGAATCELYPTWPDLTNGWTKQTAGGGDPKLVTIDPAAGTLGVFTASRVHPNGGTFYGAGRHIILPSPSDKVTCRYRFEKNVGTLLADATFEGATSGYWWYIKLDTATGNVIYERVDPAILTRTYTIKDEGDHWLVEIEASLVNDIISSIWFLLRSGGTNIPFLCMGEVYPGRVSPHLAMQADSAAVSRIADLMPLRWRPGLGWSPGRRLVCRLDVDTSLGMSEGTLLGGRSADGLTQLPLVRVTWDAAATEYRVTVTDGTTTCTAPVAVPQGGSVPIQVDAGPAGIRVAVNGTEWQDTTAQFDFSWVDEVHLGQLPDGSDTAGMPLNVRPESWS